MSLVGMGQPAGVVTTGAAAVAGSPALDGVLIGYDARVNASPSLLIADGRIPAALGAIARRIGGDLRRAVPGAGLASGCGGLQQHGALQPDGEYQSHDLLRWRRASAWPRGRQHCYSRAQTCSRTFYNQDEDSMSEHRYTVLFEPAEEGGYVVTCPALPGLVTEGDTYEEAHQRAVEAIGALFGKPAKRRRTLSS